MAFCANCGAPMGDSDKFCGECGTQVQQIPTANNGNAALGGEQDNVNDAPPAASSKVTTPLDVKKKASKLELVLDKPGKNAMADKSAATPKLTTALTSANEKPKHTVSLAKDGEGGAGGALPKLNSSPKLTEILTPKSESASSAPSESPAPSTPAPFGSGRTENTSVTTVGGALPTFGVGAAASALVDEDDDNSISGPFSATSARVVSPGQASSAAKKVSLAKEPEATPEPAPEQEAVRVSSISVNSIATSGNSGAVDQIKTHLLFSVFTTLCCCTPAGIAALICSIMCDSRQKKGDISGAQEMSTWANRINIVGCVLGILGGILYVILIAISEALDD